MLRHDPVGKARRDGATADPRWCSWSPAGSPRRSGPAGGEVIQSAQVRSRKSVAFDRCGRRTMAMRPPGGAGARGTGVERQAVLGIEVQVRGMRKHAEARRRRCVPRAAPHLRRTGSVSPRNLLMAKPRNSARSSAVSRPTVPMTEANTPPRSISATRSHGARIRVTSPRLTRSYRRRFSSLTLPAPSITTASKRAREVTVGVEHVARSAYPRARSIPGLTASSRRGRSPPPGSIRCPVGFSRIGFMPGSGSSPQASACATCGSADLADRSGRDTSCSTCSAP